MNIQDIQDRVSSFSLVQMLRHAFGRGKKPKSPFKNEREAIAFLDRAYKETGGVTPELRKAYEFYLRNYHDDCPPTAGHR